MAPAASPRPHPVTSAQRPRRRARVDGVRTPWPQLRTTDAHTRSRWRCTRQCNARGDFFDWEAGTASLRGGKRDEEESGDECNDEHNGGDEGNGGGGGSSPRPHLSVTTSRCGADRWRRGTAQRQPRMRCPCRASRRCRPSPTTIAPRAAAAVTLENIDAHRYHRSWPRATCRACHTLSNLVHSHITPAYSFFLFLVHSFFQYGM
ncbi:hypothetical protein PLICRDRAFT_449518 [Plicaturopsis crispa FD-325 SS-3]|uniref:Uncharacterized protein n=1 Tax=Plicaturopsis crispa FD-325 SS-3 TaxID=944288 RepID=A0A0C9SKD6_PLICR|nr:hypothetical protein PLICRDRAFT_449518 [Plicaturopsis crispa FD-325 SS-3]